MAVTYSAAAPPSPNTFDIWVDTDNGLRNVWNGAAWVALVAAGAVSRAGGNTTEATTTSITPVDLLSITVTAITAATHFYIYASMRKTAGAAAAIAGGLTLNATLVREAAAVGTAIWLANATDQAEHGGLWVHIFPRVTGYPRGYLGIRGASLTAAGAEAQPGSLITANVANDIPTADITTVIIRGITNNALVTAAADEGQVYPYAAS